MVNTDGILTTFNQPLLVIQLAVEKEFAGSPFEDGTFALDEWLFDYTYEEYIEELSFDLAQEIESLEDPIWKRWQLGKLFDNSPYGEVMPYEMQPYLDQANLQYEDYLGETAEEKKLNIHRIALSACIINYLKDLMPAVFFLRALDVFIELFGPDAVLGSEALARVFKYCLDEDEEIASEEFDLEVKKVLVGL